jgi:hypothetical protein
MLTRLARSTKCIAEETFGDERAYIVVKLTRCDSGLLYKTSKPRVSIVELIGKILPMVPREVTPNPRSRFRKSGAR